MVALGTGERREWHVDHLVPGATLELTIGQYWLSQGVSSIAATIAFHGIVTSEAERQTAACILPGSGRISLQWCGLLDFRVSIHRRPLGHRPRGRVWLPRPPRRPRPPGPRAPGALRQAHRHPHPRAPRRVLHRALPARSRIAAAAVHGCPEARLSPAVCPWPQRRARPDDAWRPRAPPAPPYVQVHAGRGGRGDSPAALAQPTGLRRDAREPDGDGV